MVHIPMPKRAGRPPKDPEKLAAWLQERGLDAPPVTRKRGGVNMGRPPKDPQARIDWEKKKAALDAERGIISTAVQNLGANMTLTKENRAKVRADTEVIKTGLAKIDVLRRLATGATLGQTRALICSGAPGIGKTYTVEEVLAAAATRDPANFRYEIVRGESTVMGLYKLLYRNRHCGNVVVLDDSDGVYKDEDAINMLKAATDTSARRHLTYLTESSLLAAEGIPQQFDFHGSLVFLTNLNFERYLAASAKTTLGAHLSALMSRSFYLDMDLHERDEVVAWTNYRTRECKILQREGLTDEQSEQVLTWISSQPDAFREFSIRTAIKVAMLVHMSPETWQADAAMLMHKQR
jgi:hypothetical protein